MFMCFIFVFKWIYLSLYGLFVFIQIPESSEHYRNLFSSIILIQSLRTKCERINSERLFDSKKKQNETRKKKLCWIRDDTIVCQMVHCLTSRNRKTTGIKTEERLKSFNKTKSEFPSNRWFWAGLRWVELWCAVYGNQLGSKLVSNFRRKIKYPVKPVLFLLVTMMTSCRRNLPSSFHFSLSPSFSIPASLSTFFQKCFSFSDQKTSANWIRIIESKLKFYWTA